MAFCPMFFIRTTFLMPNHLGGKWYLEGGIPTSVLLASFFSLFQFPSLWIFSGLKNKKASLEKKVSLRSGKCIGASRSALPPGKELFFLEHRKFLIEDAAADVIEGHEIEEEVEGVDSWLPNIHLRA